MIAAVIENQPAAIPIPLIVHAADAYIKELAANVVERFVIERRVGAKLFPGSAAKWGVSNVVRIGMAGAITKVAAKTAGASGCVIRVSNCMSRWVNLRDNAAGQIVGARRLIR